MVVILNTYLMRKMSQMNLIDKIIEVFDGEIVEDNKWRVDGSNGKKYQVEWHPYHRNYSCNCLGYTYRRTCKHIKMLSESFRNQLRGRAGARVV